MFCELLFKPGFIVLFNNTVEADSLFRAFTPTSLHYMRGKFWSFLWRLHCVTVLNGPTSFGTAFARIGIGLTTRKDLPHHDT